MKHNKIKVQAIVKAVSSDSRHSVKVETDSDYKYIIGIAASPSLPSGVIIEDFKIKNESIFEDDIEVRIIQSSTNVSCDHRFFTLFNPREVNSDNVSIDFNDPNYSSAYNAYFYILLTNVKPE
ncbi:MAG: hypothetical protein C0594_08005 [Marinilabiliales bacterium]|nr:MAG: hypothetical protein C0594_08005 [Marinilabiliales bacterium]